MDNYPLFNPLPAVVIGGPPHSGKSVLAHSLTRWLRERDVLHYLLRGYPPDGEGDWFMAGDRARAGALRVKGARSDGWLSPLRRDVARRQAPLIVDLGGRPTPAQEGLLDDCTHAVLLTPSAEQRAVWQRRVGRHGLVLLADLVSDLDGCDRLDETEPVIRGCVAGLERGALARGPAFEALAERLARLFGSAAAGLPRQHIDTAPSDLAVQLGPLARYLGADPDRWHPRDLPGVLAYLPQGQPLALYGRGPNWLYAAVAVHALPAPFFLFDARRGWMRAPSVSAGQPAGGALQATCHELPLLGAAYVHLSIADAYLDAGASQLVLPIRPVGGVVWGGKLPLWAYAALARDVDAPWAAVYQPQMQGAVVVRSRHPAFSVGSLIPLAPSIPGRACPMPAAV